MRGGSDDADEFFVLIPRLEGLEAGIIATRIVDTLESDAQPDPTRSTRAGWRGPRSSRIDSRSSSTRPRCSRPRASRGPRRERDGNAGERRFCTFYLGEECYGIDILTVREINRQVQITPARGAPASVRGLMNLRGQIVTVIDPPSARLPARELKKSTRLVILKTNADLASLGLSRLATNDELAGLWVDRISDVITVSEDQIAPAPPDQSGKNDHLLAAVVQLKDQVIRLVDPSALLGQDAE